MMNGPAVEGEGIDVTSNGTEDPSGFFFAVAMELKPATTDEVGGLLAATPKEKS